MDFHDGIVPRRIQKNTSRDSLSVKHKFNKIGISGGYAKRQLGSIAKNRPLTSLCI